MIDPESTIDSTWSLSEGSAERGVSRGKVGALVIIRSGESREIRVAAGSLLSSTRAELMAMRAALEEVSTVAGDLATGPVVLCTDSQAALATVAGGPKHPDNSAGCDCLELAPQHHRKRTASHAAVVASPLWHTGK